MLCVILLRLSWNFMEYNNEIENLVPKTHMPHAYMLKYSCPLP
jgi:hypothetical protein